MDKIMRNSDRGYAPVFTSAATDDPPMIEATAIKNPTSECVEVQAPASLGPGYELTVEIDGIQWIVQVPEGGVQEGELFRAKVLRKANPGLVAAAGATNKKPVNLHNIPVGRWRDGLCDCCTLGFCHAHFCLGWWFRSCALGQVMTRMNLSPFADPYPRGELRHWTTCGILTVVSTLALTTIYVISLAIFPYTPGAPEAADPGDEFWYFVKTIIVLSFSFYLFLAVCKTRAYVRRTYGIPETSCRGCEDCCCAFFCGSCAICQMARHTADYRTYRGACCSSTGLVESAPPTLAPHLV